MIDRKMEFDSHVDSDFGFTAIFTQSFIFKGPALIENNTLIVNIHTICIPFMKIRFSQRLTYVDNPGDALTDFAAATISC